MKNEKILSILNLFVYSIIMLYYIVYIKNIDDNLVYMLSYFKFTFKNIDILNFLFISFIIYRFIFENFKNKLISLFYSILILGSMYEMSLWQVISSRYGELNSLVYSLLLPVYIVCCLPVSRILFIFLAGSTMQCLFSIILYVLGKNILVSGSIARTGGTYDHPNIFYILPSIAIPLIIYAYRRNAITFKTFLFVFALHLVAFTLSWQRAATIAVGIVLVIASFAYLPPSRRRLLAVSSALVLVMFILVGRSLGNKNYISSQKSTISRGRIWVQGSKQAIQSWPQGVGMGNLKIRVRENSNTNIPFVDYLNEPKNIFILWISELGIFGTIISILFIIITWLNLKKIDINSLCFRLSWFILFFCSMFDTPFSVYDRFVGNVVFSTLIGIYCAIEKEKREQIKFHINNVLEKSGLPQSV
jgi:hypothetical protein